MHITFYEVRMVEGYTKHAVGNSSVLQSTFLDGDPARAISLESVWCFRIGAHL